MNDPPHHDSGAATESGAVSPDSQFRVAMRTLGRTGLTVSRIAIGAGPVSGLLTGEDVALQRTVVESALRYGINWIDTAPGYGQGASERNCGRILSSLPDDAADGVHVATKFRWDAASPVPLRQQLRTSVELSLRRLCRSSVTLLQLHNGITTGTGDEPSSISAECCLRPGGIADEFRELQREGMCRFLGLTGTGTPEALRRVIRSGKFDTVQLPYNMVNPSAGRVMTSDFHETNYGNILEDCEHTGLGVFAIRVFAAGAILGHPPGRHTLRTPYFPLDLYHRDQTLAEQLRHGCGEQQFAQTAIRFALAHPAIHSAIVGFGQPGHVDTAAAAAPAVASPPSGG